MINDDASADLNVDDIAHRSRHVGSSSDLHAADDNDPSYANKEGWNAHQNHCEDRNGKVRSTPQQSASSRRSDGSASPGRRSCTVFDADEGEGSPYDYYSDCYDPRSNAFMEAKAVGIHSTNRAEAATGESRHSLQKEHVTVAPPKSLSAVAKGMKAPNEKPTVNKHSNQGEHVFSSRSLLPPVVCTARQKEAPAGKELMQQGHPPCEEKEASLPIHASVERRVPTSSPSASRAFQEQNAAVAVPAFTKDEAERGDEEPARVDEEDQKMKAPQLQSTQPGSSPFLDLHQREQQRQQQQQQQQPLSPSVLFRRSGFLPTYKLLIVGDVAVGKTNLLTRYCRNGFDPLAAPTIGIEFMSRQLEVPTGRVGEVQPVVVQLWDTAGQERSSVVSSAYYRNAVGAILVYDVTRRESFLNVPRWAGQVKSLANEDCISVVVGNKTDLPVEQWAVTVAEGEQLAHSLDMRHYLVSAFNGNGVLHAFTQVVLSVNAVQGLKYEPSILPPQQQKQPSAASRGAATASNHSSAHNDVDLGEVTQASLTSFYSTQEKTLWTVPFAVSLGALAVDTPSSPNPPPPRRQCGGPQDEQINAHGSVPSPHRPEAATAAQSPARADSSSSHFPPQRLRNGREKVALDLRGFGGGDSSSEDPLGGGCAC